MSEQEREGLEPSDEDVEGHVIRRGDAEAPEGAGERGEESDEPDVEGHRFGHH